MIDVRFFEQKGSNCLKLKTALRIREQTESLFFPPEQFSPRYMAPKVSSIRGCASNNQIKVCGMRGKRPSDTDTAGDLAVPHIKHSENVIHQQFGLKPTVLHVGFTNPSLDNRCHKTSPDRSKRQFTGSSSLPRHFMDLIRNPRV